MTEELTSPARVLVHAVEAPAVGEYRGDLPAQVLRVFGSHWSSPARRSGVAVCRVPDEERAAAAE